MGWVAAAIAFAAVATAASNIYSSEQAEEAQEEATIKQTEAMEREGARNRQLQMDAAKAAEEKERILKEEEARTAAAAAEKESRTDQLRAEAQERMRSGRRALLSTGPDTWYTEPTVARKTLLGA